MQEFEEFEQEILQIKNQIDQEEQREQTSQQDAQQRLNELQIDKEELRVQNELIKQKIILRKEQSKNLKVQIIA